MGLVSWLIAIPFITAMMVVLCPEKSKQYIRWIAAIGTGLHLILTAFVTVQFWSLASADVTAATAARFTKLYMVEQAPWFKSLGISYLVGLDGISLSIFIMTSIIIFTCVMASWKVKTRGREFLALLLTIVTGVF